MALFFLELSTAQHTQRGGNAEGGEKSARPVGACQATRERHEYMGLEPKGAVQPTSLHLLTESISRGASELMRMLQADILHLRSRLNLYKFACKHGRSRHIIAFVSQRLNGTSADLMWWDGNV